MRGRSVLAVIPARSGSKGLPGKNTRPLAGLPLLAHSIACAGLVAEITDCIVSTDSAEVAQAARAFGGDLPFLRPPELAEDTTPMLPVLQHALREMEFRRQRRYEFLLLLQPTGPLRLPEDITQALEILNADAHADGVVSVSDPGFNPRYVCVEERNGYLADAFSSEQAYTRRQQVPPVYRVNGMVYLWRRDFVAAAAELWTEGARIRKLVVPRERAVDIDDQHDFELAELMIRSGAVRLPWLAAGAGRVVDQRDAHTVAQSFSAGARKIGLGEPCFIIAEAGVNHNGSTDLAHKLVDAAAAAGADAVKFQTFKSEKVVSALAPKAAYQQQTTGAQESQLEMVRKLELPFGVFRDLQAHCSRRGILFLSAPFDHESADFLDSMGVPAFKIPSGEITNIPFLQHIARKGKPLIVSTGMSTLNEVRIAVSAMRDAGARDLVLLQCVSNYPAQPASANLRAMQTMAREFGIVTGYSDHTMGTAVPLAAVALGACVVEKHFTLDKNLPGPDHRASLDPDELAAMVAGIRTVEAALGDGSKRPAAEESDTAAVARRSLVAACAIRAGTVLTAELIAILRPGTGLPPAMRDQVVGRQVTRDLEAGALLTLDMLA